MHNRLQLATVCIRYLTVKGTVVVLILIAIWTECRTVSTTVRITQMLGTQIRHGMQPCKCILVIILFADILTKVITNCSVVDKCFIVAVEATFEAVAFK